VSTSGVTSYTYTCEQYAKASLRKIGAISRFDDPEQEDIEEWMEAANLFLGTISDRSDGAPNAKFWLRKNAALILSDGKNRYTLGGSSSDLAVPLDTLIIRNILNASSLTASTTSLDVVITEDFTTSHRAAVHYNDAGLLTSTIANYSATGNVMNQPDFGAAGTWSLGTGWSIAGGVAACDGTQVAVSNLSQTTVLTSGTRYIVMTNISAYTSGTLTPVAGSTRGSALSATGWNLQFLTASGTTMLWEASEDFIGSVTSVVVIPLTGTLTLTLTTPFNRPATSAARAFFYTSTIDKPLDMLTMNRRELTGATEFDDSPMDRWNQDQYEANPDKDQEGDPTAYYYEEKLGDGYLYVDAITTDFQNKLLVFKYLSKAQVFTSNSDELDIPEVGREMLIYNVALRIAPEHGKQWTQDNELVRAEVTAVFMNSDPDTARMFFEPDRVDFGEGSGGYYS
jgi:hypothetical protein